MVLVLKQHNYSMMNIFNTKTRAVGLSDQTIVARVIMLESPTYSQDQECVAWIIQNRIDSQNSDFCTVNDAVSVVSQTTGGEKQFSTMKALSIIILVHMLLSHSGYMQMN